MQIAHQQLNALSWAVRVSAAFFFAVHAVCLEGAELPRARILSLNGDWQFRRAETRGAWKTVPVPSNFEMHEGVEFDGVGVYRRSVRTPALGPAMRLVLEFKAVATAADVTVNGQHVGTHLGGWTSFHCDITDAARAVDVGKPLRIEVRVDEKVGHNSQGFLPVFAPHFGGIWQGVQLQVVPKSWIDANRLLAVGDPEQGAIKLDVPIEGVRLQPNDQVTVRYRQFGKSRWSDPYAARLHDGPTVGAALNGRFSAVFDTQHSMIKMSVPVDRWRWWSPEDPVLYELEVVWIPQDGASGQTARQRVVTRAAFRSIRAEQNRLLLNGHPIAVRGLLNWGYAPPSNAPSIDRTHFARALKMARSRGFNLMKFCLWVPPRQYLEMADEMGMLAWMEYPTWHSQWTRDQLPKLEAEFTEFFQHDRNHPSVILRSLTCETGRSADIGVIQTLYDRCHAMIPGAVVEDDSSWIEWNRVHDFYDDHPYGNNDTWVATLDRLKRYIAQRTPKPLILGEAIAADTWTDPAELLQKVGEERPFWLPRFLDGNQAWLNTMRQVDRPESLGFLGCPLHAPCAHVSKRTTGARPKEGVLPCGVRASRLKTLAEDSRHYALLMRKYQIEAYRREVPAGGYVVSVIRDIPLCSMGLIDYLDRPKWPTAAWRWHGDTMLLLQTDRDRRSFRDGTRLSGRIGVSHFGRAPWDALNLVVTLVAADGKQLSGRHETVARISAGELTWLSRLDIELPAVRNPTRVTVRAELRGAGHQCVNEWPIWIVPKMCLPDRVTIQCHASCTPAIAALLEEAKSNDTSLPPDLVVARRFDRELFDWLCAGGRVLMLPDGEKGSFPLHDEWFLRGGPYVSDSLAHAEVPHTLLVELQHFDLAGPVIPDIKYLDQIDPWFVLWHNHDLDRVKTQGLVFATQVGKGRLVVSSLNHGGDGNAAGQWLFGTLLRRLAGVSGPAHALRPATIAGMRAKLNEHKIDLTAKLWQFQPDPKNQGLAHGWQLPAMDDHDWKPIRVGVAWEGAGYPNLDGWAWYRTTVAIPESWRGSPIYFSIEGADDYYELFVNGKKAGSGGDIATRRTAFEMRASHDIRELVKPGETANLAVRVYDWYGAGGLFRPIYLSTAPIGGGAEMLK